MNKLLVFTEAYNKGGGNRYLIDLVNSIESNFSSTLLISNYGGIYAEDTKRLNNKTITISTFKFITRSFFINKIRSYPLYFRNFASLFLVFFEPIFFIINIIIFCIEISRIKPTHILSCNGGYPGGAACLSMVVSACLLKIPVVLSVVSPPKDRVFIIKQIFLIYDKLIDYYVKKSINFVIVNAFSISEGLSKKHKFNQNNIEVINNGIEDIPVLSRPKLEKKTLIIGFVARMDYAKGAMVLLEAFAKVAISYKNINLVLAGSGDSTDEINRKIVTYGLQDRVDVLGHYDKDIHLLISTFDIFVLPSYWESYPYSILEAMRAGLPIIATSVGDIPRAIDNKKNGLLISPGSIVELSDAISFLINNPEFRIAIGNNARLKFQNSMSLNKMQEKAREVFIKRCFY